MASYGSTARVLVERMYKCIKGSSKAEYREFTTACIQLARMIDVAMAKNQKLSIQQELTQLLKKVCEQKENEMFQPAIMVLLMSVKNAICFGWFTAVERQDLLLMSKELLDLFTGVGVWNAVDIVEASQFISTSLPRFYPLLTLQTVIIALEAKTGYEAMVCDFYVLKKPSSTEELRLFVIRKDNQDTAACLVNPNHVNFLINGKGVEKRSLASLDTGPQMPTNVTGMLKNGTNLLQIVGDFPGPYLIAIALTRTSTNYPSPLNLQIYNHSGVKDQSDDELIEGPSRVSLQCPISHKRITSPVKGSSCKHHQCFDYSSFMEINSRRPSWRCPYCNTHLSFPDLRLDLQMLKILKEVESSACDVMVSEDGSWKTLKMSIAGKMDGSQTSRRKGPVDHNMSPESSAEEGEICSEELKSNVVDLTGEKEQEIRSARKHTNFPDSTIGGHEEVQDWKPDIRDNNIAWTSNMHASRLENGPPVLPVTSLTDSQSISQTTQLLPFEAGEHLSTAISTDPFQERQSNREIYRAPIAIQALPAQSALSSASFRSRLSANTSRPSSPAAQPSNVSHAGTATNSNPLAMNQWTLQAILPSFVGLHEGHVSLTSGHQQDTSAAMQLANSIQMQQQANLQQGGESWDSRQRVQQIPVGQTQVQLDQRVFREHTHALAGRNNTSHVRMERESQFQNQARVRAQFQQGQQHQGLMNMAPIVTNSQREEIVNVGTEEGIPMYNNNSPSGSAALSRRQTAQTARAVAPHAVHAANSPRNMSSPTASDLTGILDVNQRSSIARMRGSITGAARVAPVNAPSFGQQGPVGNVNYSWPHVSTSPLEQLQPRLFPGSLLASASTDLSRQWVRGDSNNASAPNLQSIQTPSTLVTDFDDWFDMQMENPVPPLPVSSTTGSMFDLDDFGTL